MPAEEKKKLENLEDGPDERAHVDEERDPHDGNETIADHVDERPEAHARDLRGQQITAHLGGSLQPAVRGPSFGCIAIGS